MNGRGVKKAAEKFKFDHFHSSRESLALQGEEKPKPLAAPVKDSSDKANNGFDRQEHYEAETGTRASGGIATEIELLIEEVKKRFLSSNDFLFLQVNQAKLGEKENNSKVPGPLERLAELIRYLGKVKLKQERELEQAVNGQLSEYERNIQKLEAKVRDHIRIEQQLRLYIEDAKARLQEADRQMKEVEEILKENTYFKEKVAAM
jgi:flagellar biosynthesis chaperone FliJ